MDDTSVTIGLAGVSRVWSADKDTLRAHFRGKLRLKRTFEGRMVVNSDRIEYAMNGCLPPNNNAWGFVYVGCGKGRTVECIHNVESKQSKPTRSAMQRIPESIPWSSHFVKLYQ